MTRLYQYLPLPVPTTMGGTGNTTGAAGSVAVGNITGLGTGVATALAVNVGSAGAFVVFNGALGTPSSGVATNLTGTAAGLTAGTASAVAVGGITGLGTGVATALAIAVGSAGGPVVNGGAIGAATGTSLAVTATLVAGSNSATTSGSAPSRTGVVASDGYVWTLGVATTIRGYMYWTNATNQLQLTANDGPLVLGGNNADILSLATAGATIASGKALKLGNAATTGLTAGVLAALTNATIVLTDSTGQAYRIPCII